MDKRHQHTLARALANRDQTLAAAMAREIFDEDPTILRSLREEAGLTQRQLAEALGVTRESISVWETGAKSSAGYRRVPDGPTAARLLALLLHAADGFAGLPKDLSTVLRAVFPPPSYALALMQGRTKR